MRTLVLLLVLATTAFAQPTVFKGKKVYTVLDGVLENGIVLVENGKITAVGTDVAIPEGATVHEAAVIIPGLVDTHSHLGVYALPRVAANSDGNEGTGPVQALVRAIDSIFPRDPGIRQAHAGGVTTANIMPGSANVMGGQTAYVKLRGKTVEQMLIDLGGGPPGMKMANGENPKNSYGRRNKAPATRMKIMALQREIFLKAQAYMAKEDRKRDLALEAVAEILQKKRTVHFHTHRADDIVSALRLADEFGFEVVLHHVTEAYFVPEEIARRKIRCSLTLLDAPGGKPEAVNLRYENAALAHAAGIEIALNTDDPVTESRLFLRTAAIAIRGGLPRDAALEALTIVPARMMHLDDRVGALRQGMDADLVLLDGDPFSVYTRVLGTWIEGERMYDRGKTLDRRRYWGGMHVKGRLPDEEFIVKDAPAAVAVQGTPPGDAKKFVLRAGVLHTGIESIPNGAVFVENGRIRAVGRDLKVPDGVPVYRVPHVSPGLIDTHGSAGLSGIYNIPADQDLTEKTDNNQAALRVIDGFNPREKLVRYLLQHGITLLHAVPGPTEPIAGQAGVFRTDRDTVAEATVKFPSAMVFNIGEAVKRGDGAPDTRMGIAAIIRQALVEAQQGSDKVDLNRAALGPVVRGELPAMFVAHREDDIQTALRIAREFKLKAMLSQATEACLMPEAIKAAGVPVLIAPTTQRPGGLEKFNSCFDMAGVCANAGIPLAFTSSFEGYVPKTRVVLFEAGVAAANRLGWQRAMQALTIDAAKILGVDKEYGSIEPGKIADLVCYDGDPLEYTSHVIAVYGKGELVFTR
ncbi:MAG: amidohydrolase family protein [Planctomycetota bacterium]